MTGARRVRCRDHLPAIVDDLLQVALRDDDLGRGVDLRRWCGLGVVQRRTDRLSTVFLQDVEPIRAVVLGRDRQHGASLGGEPLHSPVAGLSAGWVRVGADDHRPCRGRQLHRLEARSGNAHGDGDAERLVERQARFGPLTDGPGIGRSITDQCEATSDRAQAGLGGLDRGLSVPVAVQVDPVDADEGAGAVNGHDDRGQRGDGGGGVWAGRMEAERLRDTIRVEPAGLEISAAAIPDRSGFVIEGLCLADAVAFTRCGVAISATTSRLISTVISTVIA